MYANKKNEYEDLKNPGDWMETYRQPEENGPTIPYGINIVCKCGDLTALRHDVHKITWPNDVLTVEPSILHHKEPVNCHYFIRNGEYIQS